MMRTTLMIGLLLGIPMTTVPVNAAELPDVEDAVSCTGIDIGHVVEENFNAVFRYRSIQNGSCCVEKIWVRQVPYTNSPPYMYHYQEVSHALTSCF